MTRLTELEIGEWITPRKGGCLYRVEGFGKTGANGISVKLAKYPLDEGQTLERAYHPTIYRHWRSAHHKDWVRERAKQHEIARKNAAESY